MDKRELIESIVQEITEEVIGHVGVNQRIKWAHFRTMDSLILASGIVNNVDIVISNDAHFKKALDKEYILAFDK